MKIGNVIWFFIAMIVSFGIGREVGHGEGVESMYRRMTEPPSAEEIEQERAMRELAACERRGVDLTDCLLGPGE